MSTWSTHRTVLRTFLRDTDDSSYKFTNEELADWWKWAQDDLAQYVARTSLFTASDGDTSETLPSDLYKVKYVKAYDADNNYAHVVKQLDAFEIDDTNIFEGVYWYLTDDTIEFTGEDGLPCDVTIYYYAYYTPPTDTTTEITIPRWAEEAVMYYCASIAATKLAAADADLRRYASRQLDAGTPVNNPFVPVAKFMIERYQAIVFAHAADTSVRNP